MKLFHYFLIAAFLISSCNEDDSEPTFSKEYGSGLYVATSNGVSFYKDNIVKNQVFQDVNGITLTNVNKIKFRGSKVYIATMHSFYSANVETFEVKGEANGFMNLVDFDFVSSDRIFAVDKDDSKVKVLNRDIMEIISDIETGDSTKPIFIITDWYRSIIMNGGAVASSLKDSTIVAIDHKDELVPLADMMGSLYIGDNPNSAVKDNDLLILCKGVYDEDNLSENTNSSLVTVDPFDFEVESTKQLNASGARNLVHNHIDDVLLFISPDGVCSMSTDGSDNIILPIISDVIYYQDEEFSVYSAVDSTYTYYNRNILYLNDAENNKNTIYKYNLDLGLYIDTIIVDGDVRSISFY
ncbi:hypothetical protein OAK24_02465 [Flavobacteriales bacterium]|nr:hypothetical protein [Flavobacteriales bacterium]